MLSNENDSNASLKIAIVMALLRSKLLVKPTNESSSAAAATATATAAPPAPADESEALRWRRKQGKYFENANRTIFEGALTVSRFVEVQAKERKQELLRLKEDLKEAEDSLRYDLFPQTASCKCYFFDNLGKLGPKQFGDGSDHRFSDVLRRRFLRQVRLQERKRRRTDGSIQRWHYSDFNIEDETEQLRASVDFLVELCDTVSPVVEANFANWSHQAADFILASLKNLLSMGENKEAAEVIVNSLIMRLVRRMYTPLQGDEVHLTDADPQSYVQHLIRKLGSEPYIGQRAILSVSQRISVLAESLLFLDPFDDAFPNMHSSMFIMIQLIEFLVSDYLLAWPRDDGFDKMLFEESVTSFLHARKALELMESKNGLYVLYMDRVTGELAKQVGQVSALQNLNSSVLDNLFR